MKKFVSVLFAVLLLIVSGCSDPDEGYAEAYENVLSEIEAMNTSTDEIANYNLYAWEKVGASDIAESVN